MNNCAKKISDEVYFASPEMSKHALDAFEKNPWGWLKAKEEGKTLGDEQTPAMIFGTAVHCAVLEAKEFETKACVLPDEIPVRRGAKYEVFVKKHPNRIILKAEEFERVKLCASAIAQCKSAEKLLGVCPEKELALFWTAQGFEEIPLKSKLDALSVEQGIIIDLKTCADASTDAFMRSCESFNYHRQAAFYLDAFTAVYGVKPQGFAFVCVETEYPFTPAVYTFDTDSDFILAGREGYRSALALYSQLKSGEIPVPVGYREHNPSLPPWSKDLAKLRKAEAEENI